MRPFHSMHASDIRHNHRDSSLQHRSIGRPTGQEARREWVQRRLLGERSVCGQPLRATSTPLYIICFIWQRNKSSCRSQHLIGARTTQGGTHKYGELSDSIRPIHREREMATSGRYQLIKRLSHSHSPPPQNPPATGILTGRKCGVDPATGRLNCSLDALPCMAVYDGILLSTAVPVARGLLESLIHSWT